MCGRMTLTRSGSEIAEYFSLALREDAEILDFDGRALRPRYNVAPSQWIPTVLLADTGVRTLQWKQWGLIPSWSKSPTIGARLFNARSETAAEKPSFRAAWKRRRCLVVADGFYEWTPRNRDHQPYHFRPRETPLLGFAGLFEEWHGDGGEVIESCTVLTTAASADLEGIHHRMPVILQPTDFEPWLQPEPDFDALQAMMHPADAGTLEARAVSRAVNDARFDDPSCLAASDAPSAEPDDVPDETPAEATKSKKASPARDQGELFGPPEDAET